MRHWLVGSNRPVELDSDERSDVGLQRWLARVAFLLTSVICNAQNASVATDELAPEVDHHQHLLSPQGAALLNSPRNAVDLPARSRRS